MSQDSAIFQGWLPFDLSLGPKVCDHPCNRDNEAQTFQQVILVSHLNRKANYKRCTYCDEEQINSVN